MNVVLTIDVETYTGDYERDVFAGGKGLAYLLDVCAQFNVKATFFVEALGVTQWGKESTRMMCSMIRDAGHEVGLHLHPNVARIKGFTDNVDVLWEHDRRTQQMLLETGLAGLRDGGVDAVTSFRAGDFAADERTLAAMTELGLTVSANRDLDMKSSIRSRLNAAFPVTNDLSKRGDIVDLPVAVLRSPFPKLDGAYRHMEISAMGLRETCDGLARMARAGYATAGILTHPPEFYRYAGDAAKPIGKNCRRLEGLLKFVSGRDDMQFATVAECVTECDIPHSQPPILRARRLWSLVRVVEQAKDRVLAGCGGVFSNRS